MGHASDSAILVVDDTPENRRLYALILQQAGCAITEAASGEEALARCDEHAYAMILVDVHLPGIDGFETARRIRQFACCALTPIVFVSAIYTSDEHRFKGYGEGAVDYILAPVVPAILRAKARVFVEIDRHRRQVEELAQRLEHQNHQLAAAYENLEGFSYAAAHDLRAPLRTIGTLAELMLAQQPAAPTAPPYDQPAYVLQRIVAATHRMNALIDALLRLATVTSSTMIRERVDLSALARTIADELQHDLPHAIDWVIAPGLTARGDPELLRIVLVNLLGNAAKYTLARDCAQVEFGCATHNGEAAYFVRDNGVGFDAAHAADKLFKPFQRFHSAEQAPGSGVGLATVQRIVTKHGGRLAVQSAPGAGATFWFTLGSDNSART